MEQAGFRTHFEGKEGDTFVTFNSHVLDQILLELRRVSRDISVHYDKDPLKMANEAIERQRQHVEVAIALIESRYNG